MTSEQDFIRLSAYLDNQLATADRAALEVQLARDPELKAALRDLRLQVRAMRALPRRRVPRNFTLSAAQAEQLRRRSPFAGFFPTFRLATSLSAAAFAIVTALAVLRPAALPVAMAPAQAPAPQTALTADVLTAKSAAGSAESGPANLAAPPEAATGGSADTATVDGFATDAGADSPTLELFSVAGVETPSPTELAYAAEATPEAARQALPGGEGQAGNAEADAALTTAAAPLETPPPLALTPLQQWAIGLGALTAILAALTWSARRR